MKIFMSILKYILTVYIIMVERSKKQFSFKWINSKNVIVHSSFGLTGYKNKLANIDRPGFEK